MQAKFASFIAFNFRIRTHFGPEEYFVHFQILIASLKNFRSLYELSTFDSYYA